MPAGSKPEEWPLPCFVSPFDLLVQRALMDDPPRRHAGSGARVDDQVPPAGQPQPGEDEPRSVSIEEIMAGWVPVITPEAFLEEQLIQAFQRTEIHTFWLALGAVSLQQQAASVLVPTEVVSRAARLARVPDDVLASIEAQPPTSLLGCFERVGRRLTRVEPAAGLRGMELTMFLPALIGAALHAGLADSLVVPTTLALEVAEWLSLPQGTAGWLRGQSPTTVRGWVDRLRAHYGLPDTQ